jgi:hypothetical protein
MGKLAIAVIIAVACMMGTGSAQTVSRTISPKTVDPGETIFVVLKITVPSSKEGVIIAERPPTGWSVANPTIQANKQGNGEWAWLLFSKNGTFPGYVNYTLVVSGGEAGGQYAITGSWKSISTTGELKNGTYADDSVTVRGANPSSPTGGGGGGAPTISVQEAKTEEKQSAACEEGSQRCDGPLVLRCEEGAWVDWELCDTCEDGECVATASEPEQNETDAKLDPGGVDVTGRFLSENAPLLGAVVVAIAGAVGVRYLKKPKRAKDKTVYDFFSSKGDQADPAT